MGLPPCCQFFRDNFFFLCVHFGGELKSLRVAGLFLGHICVLSVLVQSALRNKFAERRNDCPAHVGRIPGLVKSSGHLRNGDCSTLLATGTPN